MKKLIILLSATLWMSGTRAQQLMNHQEFVPSLKSHKKRVSDQRKIEADVEKVNKGALLPQKELFAIAEYLPNFDTSWIKNQDTANANAALREAENLASNSLDTTKDNVLDELNNAPNFWVSGLGGVSKLSSLDNINGNFSISTTFRLGKYRQIGNGWVDPAYLYLAFNTKTDNSTDSSLSKTFLFPDIAKCDFVLGGYFEFTHLESGWTIAPTLEFSLNTYQGKIDSSSKSFQSQSGLFGIKFSKSQNFTVSKDSTYQAGFSLFPYISLVNVQDKDMANYEAMMKHTDAPATVFSVGLQATLTISKLQIFSNMKYVARPYTVTDIPDLHGFTYIIGTVVNVDILKFKLGD